MMRAISESKYCEGLNKITHNSIGYNYTFSPLPIYNNTQYNENPIYRQIEGLAKFFKNGPNH